MSFTATSKLAQDLRDKNEEELKSASNLTIDEVLNVKNLPMQPTSKYAAWANLRNTENGMQYYQQDAPKNMLLNQKRASFFQKRFDSIKDSVDSSSLDELTNSNMSLLQENSSANHKLRILESNFSQISMANYADEKTLQKCIEIYKEKFQKTDSYMRILFDEMNDNLIKLVEYQGELFDEIDEAFDLKRCKLNSESSNQDEVDLSSCSNCEHELCTKSRHLNKSCIKQNKFLVQEKLNKLNKTFDSLKINLINLVTTSSILSSLKQVYLKFF